VSDALTTALADVDRMHANACKAAASPRQIITGGGTPGIDLIPAQMGKAKEQLSHLTDWVWAAVRLVATRIAGQPIHVSRQRRTTTRKLALMDEVIEDHPLLDVLNDPSDWFTRWSLMFSTIAGLECTGRALWWVTDDDGKPSIFYLSTSWIEEIDPRRAVWHIRPYGSVETFALPGEEVVHFHYPDPGDPLGCLSPLQRIAKAVVADEEIGTAQWSAFRTGIHPTVGIRVGRLPGMIPGQPGERPVLDPEQKMELVDAVLKLYRGVVRKHEPIILDGIIEGIEQFSRTVQEMDFLDSAKLTKSKILQSFGVSPILLGEVENSNRASATVADEIFVANKVNPLAMMLSESMTEWLGPMFAQGERLRVWIEPAVAHDPEMSRQKWDSAARLGFVTQNEFRRNVLNLDSVDGGDVFRDALGNVMERSADPILHLGASRNGSTARR